MFLNYKRIDSDYIYIYLYKKKVFYNEMMKYWRKLSEGVVDAPYLETFKINLSSNQQVSSLNPAGS